MKKILISFFLIVSLSSSAQSFFFIEDLTDTASNDFYEYNKHFCVMYQANWPENLFGLSLFIHNEDQRLSYYVEFKTNYKDDYIIDGEVIETGTKIQKRGSYSRYILGTGIGVPIRKNLMAYGNVGILYQKTLNDINPDRGNNFDYKDKTDFHLGVGFLYVTKKGFSGLVGADLTTLTLNVGIGYSF